MLNGKELYTCLWDEHGRAADTCSDTDDVESSLKREGGRLASRGGKQLLSSLTSEWVKENELKLQLAELS